MPKKLTLLLLAAGLACPLRLPAAQFADAVVAYSPGTGFATDFATGAGFTNATAALGEPSRATPGVFGGPVDPFNPPYLKEQLVSIGAGGSLTLSLNPPILNDPNHPFGLDVILFGNSGFVITNGDFSGGGVTDGSLFGANPGAARVSVSADNLSYYTLDSTRAPAVDTLFPTDGSGRFDLPVDPNLTAASFAGLGLSGIRSLYDGSAGGAAFDLSWAQDAQGHPADLAAARYVRIDVLSGAVEIDGLTAVRSVPEPAPWALLALGLSGAGLAWRRRGSRPGKGGS